MTLFTLSHRRAAVRFHPPCVKPGFCSNRYKLSLKLSCLGYSLVLLRVKELLNITDYYFNVVVVPQLLKGAVKAY